MRAEPWGIPIRVGKELGENSTRDSREQSISGKKEIAFIARIQGRMKYVHWIWQQVNGDQCYQ